MFGRMVPAALPYRCCLADQSCAPPLPAGEGFTSMNLMLTEDQAAVLLDQGSRAVVEVEQARRCCCLSPRASVFPSAVSACPWHPPPMLTAAPRLVPCPICRRCQAAAGGWRWWTAPAGPLAASCSPARPSRWPTRSGCWASGSPRLRPTRWAAPPTTGKHAFGWRGCAVHCRTPAIMPAPARAHWCPALVPLPSPIWCSYGPPPVGFAPAPPPPGMAYLAGPWQPGHPGGMLPQQQQQQMIAAAASAAAAAAGMMPPGPLPLPVRQGSGGAS